MDEEEIARIVELGLLCSPGPCSERKLAGLFEPTDKVDGKRLSSALKKITADWEGKALEVVNVASGWQLRSKAQYKDRLHRFLESSPPRLSRPLLEVLAIVAYHQPATRGDIEEIRGVTTSAGQLETLGELGWVEVTGNRETPGRPLLYETTAKFLDDLGLSDIKDLPPIEEFAVTLQQGQVDPEREAKDNGSDSAQNSRH